MVDLAPAGCLSLRDFYDAFTRWKWNTASFIEELDLEVLVSGLPSERRLVRYARLESVTDQSLDEVVRLFSSGKMSAFVFPAGSERRFFSKRSWEESYYPSRFFLDANVQGGHDSEFDARTSGSEFDAALGRTLFVSKASVAKYFAANRATRASTPSSLALRDLLVGLVADGILQPAKAEELRYGWGLHSIQKGDLDNLPTPMEEAKVGRTPQMDAAREALLALYPNGISKKVGNKQLLIEVNDWLGLRGEVSRRTLARVKADFSRAK